MSIETPVEATIETTGMRVGELARRCGVTTATLRAWESRYGLLRPQRSTGGYRMYDGADERRVLAVAALRAQGVSASDACAQVLTRERGGQPQTATSTAPAAVSDFVTGMHAAVDTYDEVRVQAELDRLLAHVSLDVAIDDALMPFLHELGTGWQDGEVSVAQEHFVSGVIRRRLGVLLSGRPVSRGPLAVIAAPAGEEHDIALLALSALLVRAGWRVRFLGANTPAADIAGAAGEADVVVLGSSSEHLLTAEPGPLRRLAAQVPLVVGGRGATPRAAKSLKAARLPERISDSAEALTTIIRSRS